MCTPLFGYDADQDWIPTEEGYSLYLRPTVISTHPYREFCCYLSFGLLSAFHSDAHTACTPLQSAWRHPMKSSCTLLHVP